MVENKRSDAILEALDLINNDRNRSYGEPVDNFRIIAQRWSIGREDRVEPWKVALQMIDLKMARMNTTGRFSRDSLIDIIGYAALAIEVHDET